MSASTTTAAAKVIKISELDKVKKNFLSEIEKNGIVKTFEWMSQWFDLVARAQLDDEIKEKLGENSNNPQAKGLYVAAVVSELAGIVNNPSSLDSMNVMRRSRLAAAASLMQRGNAYGSNQDRSNAWALEKAKIAGRG